MPPNDKPLLTMIVCSYNQEEYIRHAIEGAFAQTYSPLEIILSDDCSKDRTFEIMREMAEKYRGPHRVVLNKTPKNVGLTGHLNCTTKMANGSLFIGAAGDDISMPERVAATAEVWESSGRRATSIYGRWLAIDENGKRTDWEKSRPWPKVSQTVTNMSVPPLEYLETLNPRIQGSCHTFSAKLFSTFGPLPEYVINEDTAMGFRSLLVGEIYYIDKPLVYYRRHSQNTFAPINMESVSSTDQLRAYDKQRALELKRYITLYDGFREDLQSLIEKGGIEKDKAAQLDAAISKYQRRLQLNRDMFTSGLFKRIGIASELARGGERIRPLIPRLLPRPLYEFGFLTRARLRGKKS